MIVGTEVYYGYVVYRDPLRGMFWPITQATVLWLGLGNWAVRGRVGLRASQLLCAGDVWTVCGFRKGL